MGRLLKYLRPPLRLIISNLGDALAQIALTRSYSIAKHFSENWAIKLDQFDPLLAGIQDIPIDIKPIFN